MNELTDRQKLVLTLVIHEYTYSAAPVGSTHLVEKYRLDLSSATVRNEMAVLTDMGYLRQPHTSAGRIPTEEGYRFFVGRLLQETELPNNTRRTISHQFYQMRNDVDQWMRLSASVLANQSRGASLVTAPHSEQAFFKHIELIATRGRQVLMVLVLVGGEIRQRFLTMQEPVQQYQLSEAAGQITSLCDGKDANSLLAIKSSLNNLEQEVIDSVIEEMRNSNAVSSGEVFIDGLTNVLAEPEFAGSEDARKALRLLEERSTLQDLVSRTFQSSSPSSVQVLIGGEGTWDELRQFSLVLARYGMPGVITGTLGVFGPLRMPYGRTISTVRFISGLLSDLVTDTLIEGNDHSPRRGVEPGSRGENLS